MRGSISVNRLPCRERQQDGTFSMNAFATAFSPSP